MRFKILPKVDGLRLRGVLYKPGDVVDLPPAYERENWLEKVDPEVVVSAPLQEITPVDSVPLEKPTKTHKGERSTSKKSKTS